jgi:hypothetical protein
VEKLEILAESMTRTAINLSAGNCLIGITVNFYGFAELKHLKEQNGSSKIKFVMNCAESLLCWIY